MKKLKMAVLKSLVLSTSMALASVTLAAPMREGGITAGGGGGVLPSGLPTNDLRIQEALKTAKNYVLAYVNQAESDFKHLGAGSMGRTEELYFMFSDKEKLKNQIEQLPIELKTAEPCYDLNGEAVAGSMHGSQPGSICISSFLLSQQVTEWDYEAQLAALILHEVSHQLGADEAMAVRVQKRAFETLRHHSPLEIAQQFFRASAQASSQESGLLQILNSKNPYRCGAFKALVNGIGGTDLQANRAGFSQISASDYLQSIILRTRIMTMAEYICSKDESISKSERDAAAKRYESFFGLRSAPFENTKAPISQAEAYEIIVLDNYKDILKVKTSNDFNFERSEIARLVKLLDEEKSKFAKVKFEVSINSSGVEPGQQKTVCETGFFPMTMDDRIFWGKMPSEIPGFYKIKTWNAQTSSGRFSEDLFMDENGDIISASGEVAPASENGSSYFTMTVYREKNRGLEAPEALSEPQGSLLTLGFSSYFVAPYRVYSACFPR